jgi:hypothetical protein
VDSERAIARASERRRVVALLLAMTMESTAAELVA